MRYGMGYGDYHGGSATSFSFISMAFSKWGKLGLRVLKWIMGTGMEIDCVRCI